MNIQVLEREDVKKTVFRVPLLRYKDEGRETLVICI